MKHIGFIMDGNRRWAKKLHNITKFGHQNGAKKFEEVIQWAHDIHIPFVSFWALSKENILERSKDELDAIYDIFRSSFPHLLTTIESKNMRISTVGDLSLLPSDISTSLTEATRRTENNTNMTIILAIAYSGQDEIIRAVKKYISSGHDRDTLDEKIFLEYLDSGKFPPPDLIIRTGGAIRHSGYFLYQSAYSEYFFVDTLWPDFSQDEFRKAISYLNSTQRNFGR